MYCGSFSKTKEYFRWFPIFILIIFFITIFQLTIMRFFVLVFCTTIAHSIFAQSLEFQEYEITEEKPYVEIIFEGQPSKKGYKKTLLLQNTGTATLLIQKVEASCDCIKARIKKKKLKEGQQTALIMHWKPSGDTEFSGAISVQSNDPNYKELWIHLLGNMEG